MQWFLSISSIARGIRAPPRKRRDSCAQDLLQSSDSTYMYRVAAAPKIALLSFSSRSNGLDIEVTRVLTT